MRKLILGLVLVTTLSGCLIEEKKYYGCGDAKCCASDEDLDVKAHDDAVEDAEKDFADLFEEVTDTK